MELGSTKNNPIIRSAKKPVYLTLPLPTGQASVVREAKRMNSQSGLTETVLVGVMKFDSILAAELWVSGQGELAERGEWAGYADPKQDPAVMDQSEDTFNLG